jgi:pimeloyl-CoA synthetase
MIVKCNLFCRVRGLVCSSDPENYTGGSIATGSVTHAGKDEGEEPDQERYPVPSRFVG